MPRGLHFNRVQNPIRVFHLAREPVGGRQRALRVTLEIDGRARLQLRAQLGITRAINNRIHVHVTGDVRDEFGALAGENVHTAAG